MKIGDRVCYTAKFLRLVGAVLGTTARRQGTLAGVVDIDCWVHWDDEAEDLAENPDAEYVAHVRANGTMVKRCNICVVGNDPSHN